MEVVQCHDARADTHPLQVIRRPDAPVDALCISSSSGSEWVFSSLCTAHAAGAVHPSKVRLRLCALDSLRFEGAYDHTQHRWRRVYETLHGVTVHLLEESAATGGQGCLWGAALVLARFVERHLTGLASRCSILELGAGAGLPTLVAASYGLNATATEQTTCFEYLQRNLSLNSADIPARSSTLQWGKDFVTEGLEDKYDVIIGGDITYDDAAFDVLFETLDRFSHATTSIYLCHDNDSCPLSPDATFKFNQLASKYKFEVEQLDLDKLVDPPYFHHCIVLQKLMRIRADVPEDKHIQLARRLRRERF